MKWLIFYGHFDGPFTLFIVCHCHVHFPNWYKYSSIRWKYDDFNSFRLANKKWEKEKMSFELVRPSFILHWVKCDFQSINHLHSIACLVDLSWYVVYICSCMFVVYVRRAFRPFLKLFRVNQSRDLTSFSMQTFHLRLMLVKYASFAGLFYNYISNDIR